MTNNLERRVYEHKNKLVAGFTKKYNINKLVYFEETSDVTQLFPEKRKSKMATRKKDSLVLSNNPEWKDISEEWC